MADDIRFLPGGRIPAGPAVPPPPEPVKLPVSPGVRPTDWQRGDIRDFNKEFPAFKDAVSRFRPATQDRGAASPDIIKQFLQSDPVAGPQADAAFTQRLESPAQSAIRQFNANFRPNEAGFAQAGRSPVVNSLRAIGLEADPHALGVASRTAFGTPMGPQPAPEVYEGFGQLGRAMPPNAAQQADAFEHFGLGPRGAGAGGERMSGIIGGGVDGDLRQLRPERGAWNDLKATGAMLRDGAGRAGEFVDGMFAKAAPVLNHPAVATAGRGLAVLGSVADAKSGYDAIAQGAAASNKRMDDAYHRGGDSYLSPEYLKTLGKETLGQTYAGVRAMPLVGSVVRGAEGLQDWLTGKNKPAPAASNEPITYDEATHSFSRAPTNMAEYEQMQKAREQAQAGLPRMNFSANGRDVSLTPSEVNAAAAVPLEGGGTMRDAIMNVGYRTNPNTNIRVGDGSGAGAGAAAPGGNAPSREQQRVEAYLDMAKRRHLPVSAANAGLDYESQMRGLEAQQPLRDAQADYYRTPKPVKGNDQIATGLNKLLQQSQSVELALMSPELQRDPQRYKQAQLFAKYLKDQIVAYQQSLRGDPYQPDTRSIVNNLPE